MQNHGKTFSNLFFYLVQLTHTVLVSRVQHRDLFKYVCYALLTTRVAICEEKFLKKCIFVCVTQWIQKLFLEHSDLLIYALEENNSVYISNFIDK